MGVAEPPRDTRSFASLVRELSVTAAELLRGELRLARLEAGEIGASVARGGMQVILGAVLILLGALSLATAVVLVAGDQWLPDDRYWLAAFGILVITAALAVWLARRGMSQLHPSQLAPGRTLETLKEDTEWLRQRMKSGATSS